MENWDKKINAAKELKRIIEEKDSVMNVYLTLKNILKEEMKLSNPKNIMTKEEAVGDYLRNSLTDKETDEGSIEIEKIIEETNINTPEKGSEKIEKMENCIEEYSETTKKVGERYTELMDGWIEAVKEEEHNEKNRKSVMKALEGEDQEEFRVMKEVMKYKKKLPKMWMAYEILKEQEDKEVDRDDLYRLDENLDEILNFLNDEKYGSGKAYV